MHMTGDPQHGPIIRRQDYVPAADQEKFIVPLLRDRIEANLREHCQPRPAGSCVLDVGCGRQPFRHLLESMGYRYTGLDVAQNPENSVDLIGLLDGDLTGIIESRPRHDFLLCTEVLEHVPDWLAAFANLARLAAPGGRVLITCPHFYQLHEQPHDYWRPTLNALRYHAERSGFDVVHSEAAGDGWDVLGTVLANLQIDSVSDRWMDRTIARGIRHGFRKLFNSLHSRTLPRRVRLTSPLYLSNVMVLERR